MYAVSDDFLEAVQKNTRNYYWSGTITTTDGTIYAFDYDDILKGSGYIMAQCCGSTEVELGGVYSAELGITLFSDVDRYTLEVFISNLNIRKGAGTNYAKTGKYTGKGVFTITQVKSGTGSDAGWGKLKSGAGWIALSYCTLVS